MARFEVIMAEKLTKVKININNINMLRLHNYVFLQKLNKVGSNPRLGCAKVSVYFDSNITLDSEVSVIKEKYMTEFQRIIGANISNASSPNSQPSQNRP